MIMIEARLGVNFLGVSNQVLDNFKKIITENLCSGSKIDDSILSFNPIHPKENKADHFVISIEAPLSLRRIFMKNRITAMIQDQLIEALPNNKGKILSVNLNLTIGAYKSSKI